MSLYYSCNPPCRFDGRVTGRPRAARLFVYPGNAVKTNVYVDGFNYYYGCFKSTPQYRAFKWLDLRSLCAALLPGDLIHRVNYFTAMVAAVSWDKNQPFRQETYIRALRTLPKTYVHLGNYQPVVKTGMPVNAPPGSGSRPERFRTWEEKGSDVNLATRLLIDAVDGDFEQALLLSNDSDLYEPIKIVKQKFGLPVVVLSPFPTLTIRLQRASSSWGLVDKSRLARHQLPRTIVDGKGRRITKQTSW
jgi:hypothetical protein